MRAHISPDGAVIRYRGDAEVPPAGWTSVPVLDVAPPLGEGEVWEGPRVIVHADRVERAWMTRPAPAPREVTAYQARAALLAAGLLDAVEAQIAAGDRAAQIAWEYATTITREGALVAAVAAALDLTAEQLDNLFREAARIEA